MDTQQMRKNREFVWTVEECVSNGGHCYGADPYSAAGYVIDTMPPTHHRCCKHCGHTQHGHEQPNMNWVDS